MADWEDKLGAILNDPSAMGQIMQLAQSISGGEGAKPSPGEPAGGGLGESAGAAAASPLSMLGDLDPRLLQMGARLMGELQTGDDRNTALLAALRPFLRSERYARLDKAIQLARLSRVIRVALQSLGKTGGEGDV